MDFPFERLSAYQFAVKWNGLVAAICERRTPLPGPFLDQLMRASMSIPLNIAEASGRFHPKERRQFYNIARASTFECVAILQILKSRNLLSSQLYEEAYALLGRLSRTLYGLIRTNTSGTAP